MGEGTIKKNMLLPKCNFRHNFLGWFYGYVPKNKMGFFKNGWAGTQSAGEQSARRSFGLMVSILGFKNTEPMWRWNKNQRDEKDGDVWGDGDPHGGTKTKDWWMRQETFGPGLHDSSSWWSRHTMFRPVSQAALERQLIGIDLWPGP